MKKFFLSLSFCLGLLSAASSADEKPHTYEGAITGVVCAACKEHITVALTKKLPGVVSVGVKATDSPDSKILTIVSTDPGVTKESANAALGSYAKNYQILSLARKD